MDPTRFDALVRSFATAGTRRRILAVLAALPLGGVLLGLDDEEAAAERPRDRVKRHNKQHHRKRRNQHHKHKNKHKHHKKLKNKAGKGGKGGKNPDPCTANGGACNQDSDCCGRNCFNQVCADTVTECDGTACSGGAAGCCPSGCCESPANQCNGVGECCVPNCDGRRCGLDGCGNTGTCGTCPSGSECDKDTGQCGCTPQTCPNGCCDANGDCQPGNTEQACGDGGVTCTNCGSNQHCSTQTGTCRDNPPCSAETCPNGCCDLQNGIHVCRTDRRGCSPGGACCTGCCDSNDECQDGDDDGACGAGGSRCVACDPLDQCDQGRCQCDANNCPGCCDNGPGNPGFCEQGTPTNSAVPAASSASSVRPARNAPGKASAHALTPMNFVAMVMTASPVRRAPSAMRKGSVSARRRVVPPVPVAPVRTINASATGTFARVAVRMACARPAARGKPVVPIRMPVRFAAPGTNATKATLSGPKPA